MAEKHGDSRCWIDTDKTTISFHEVNGYVLHAFNSRKELMDFVWELLTQQNYKVQ